MNVTGFVNQETFNNALKPYKLKENLKALDYKDSAADTVAGEIITGIKATNFTPLLGEVIIYKPDETHIIPHLKIGE